MKVSYLTTYDASHIGASSRTGYFMGQALKEQFEVSYLGPLTTKQGLLLKFKKALYKKLLRGKYDPGRDASVLRQYARQAGNQLARCNGDFVLSPGTDPIAFLDSKKPIVLWWDALFAGWQRLSAGIVNYSRATIRDGHRMEREALARCQLAVFSSDWAAQTAIDDYGTDRSKVHIIPFGPNLVCNESRQEIEAQVSQKSLKPLKLLFVAGDWKNKRADLAVQVTEKLNARNVPATLTVVGCAPADPTILPACVHLTGFLDKADPAAAERLKKLYAEAHFFILPTTRDCSPVVISEANAFGVPALSTSVGGIPTLIRPGANGALFSQHADATAYVDFVMDRISSSQKYRELAFNSYLEYEKRFKWSVGVRRLKELVEPLLHRSN